MSSMTIRSARQIRATVRAVEPSIFVWPMTACSVSRVNQATFRSFSIAACGQAFGEVALAGAGRPGDHEVLRAADPFQGASASSGSPR